MPLYEFRCPCGHLFEHLCRSGDMQKPACPRCGGATERVFSSFSVGRSAPAAPAPACSMQGEGGASPCSSCSFRHAH